MKDFVATRIILRTNIKCISTDCICETVFKVMRCLRGYVLKNYLPCSSANWKTYMWDWSKWIQSLRSLMDSITSGRIVVSYPSSDAEESKTFSLAFLTEPIIILTIVVPGGGVRVLHSTEAGNSSSRNLERHGRVVTEVDLPRCHGDLYALASQNDNKGWSKKKLLAEQKSMVK